MKRKLFFTVITGVFVSFCYVAGYLLELQDSLDMKEVSFYLKWLFGAVCASGILYVLWEALDRYGEKRKGRQKAFHVKFSLSRWLCVLILLICWMPAWLSLFPGAFAYDAYSEWEQIKNGMITAHHPVIHVLLSGGLTEGLHSLTGSYNVGIAVYTFLQMFILACVLAGSLSFFRKFNVPDVFQWIALLFYGFSPVMQLFAISVTKDVLFTAAQFMFLINLIEIGCRRKAFFEDRKRIASFGVTAFFTMILRNNGFYIVLFTLVVLTIVCRKEWRRIFPVLLGIGIAYGAYIGPFYSVLHVSGGGVEEMLSVPLQQMARVHKYDYASVEQEDLELLYQFVPEESLESYRATVSDFVKNGFNREKFNQHKKEFFMLWCKWGMEHPLTYVNSFLINTVDFWYPNAVVDGYQDAYGRSSYFDYKVSEPGEEIVLLPGVHRYYEAISLEPQVQKMPFVFLVLSPGWYLMFTVIVFMYHLRCRRYEFLFAGGMILLSLLTVLLGPIALVRYVLILYFAFPVLLPTVLYPERFAD